MGIGSSQFVFSKRQHENFLEHERAQPDPGVIADYLPFRSDVITIDALSLAAIPKYGQFSRPQQQSVIG